MVHPKETAGYQTFPGRIPSSARRNLSGISRSHSSSNTINIFKWYSMVLRYNFYSNYTLFYEARCGEPEQVIAHFSPSAIVIFFQQRKSVLFVLQCTLLNRLFSVLYAEK